MRVIIIIIIISVWFIYLQKTLQEKSNGNKERKRAENYNKWHNKFILKPQLPFVANFKP